MLMIGPTTSPMSVTVAQAKIIHILASMFHMSSMLPAITVVGTAETKPANNRHTSTVGSEGK